jgi:hypothetical protein
MLQGGPPSEPIKASFRSWLIACDGAGGYGDLDGRKKVKRKVGRPTKYRPEFCAALIEHMRRGLTFEAFGASKEIGVAKDTLYEWLKRHKEFSDARKRGMPLLEYFYIQTGLSIATGQVRRVSSEEPMLDAAGAPIRDPVTGKILMRREYAPANTNATAYIFLVKNVLGWRDKRDINHGGQTDNPVRVAAEATPAERLIEIKRLAARREACGDD